MRIILGSDHGGFSMKEKIKEEFLKREMRVVDVGASEYVEGDDFVDFAIKGVEEITNDDRLILFCRNGFGMCIAANRYNKIRCGIAFDVEAVKKGRLDDDINALSIPSDYFDFDKILSMINVFLSTKFDGDEKYENRINKLNHLN